MPAAILHLLRSAQAEEGTGPARIVSALAANLDPRKYNVHVWFFGPPGALVDDLRKAGATARSINWLPGLRDPAGAYRFWRCFRNHDFAIVHHHFGGRSIRRLIRFSSRARLVVQLHARIPEEDSSRSNPISVRGADLTIAVSRALALQIQNLKARVVYPGVEARRNICIEQISNRTDVVIGTASRLVDIKKISDLIRAMALLHREFPNLRLEIAGAGPESDKLEREVGHLGLKDRVRFLGWQRELVPVFRTWDIFALPSSTEGLPMAVLEAMAEGLPVVATDVGGLPELLKDGETGYLVPPSDVKSLSEHLRLLVLDPKRRRTMGLAGWHRVRSHFSVERMVEEITAIYDALMVGAQYNARNALQ